MSIVKFISTIFFGFFLSPIKDPTLKDVLVIRINSVAALMVSQYNKVHMVMVAIVRKLNINAAQMESLPLKERTLLDAHVLPANTDAVQMALTMHRAHNLRDAMKHHLRHKKRAASARMVVAVAIIPLNTSSIWNMVVAHDSGTAVAAEMLIVSKPLMNARAHANNRLAKMRAKCQRFMVHAQDTIRNTTTIQTETFAHHSYMVVAWVIRIDSKHLKNVNSNVLLMKHCVSPSFECFICNMCVGVES